MKGAQGSPLTKPMAVNTGLRNCAACDSAKINQAYLWNLRLGAKHVYGRHPFFIYLCTRGPNSQTVLGQF